MYFVHALRSIETDTGKLVIFRTLTSVIIGALVLWLLTLGLFGLANAPTLITGDGASLRAETLAKSRRFNGIETAGDFHYRVPEFRSIEREQRWWSTHEQIWRELERNEVYALELEDGTIRVTRGTGPPVTSVMLRNGAIYAVGGLFYAFAIFVFLRHRTKAGIAAAIFMFSVAVYLCAMAPLVARPLTLEPVVLKTLLNAYYFSTAGFASMVFFPFAFPRLEARQETRLARFVGIALGIYVAVASVGYVAGFISFGWTTPIVASLVVVMIVRIVWVLVKHPDPVLRRLLATSMVALTVPAVAFAALVNAPIFFGNDATLFQYVILISIMMPFVLASALDTESIYHEKRQADALIESTIGRIEEHAHALTRMHIHDHVANGLLAIITAARARGAPTRRQRSLTQSPTRPSVRYG